MLVPDVAVGHVIVPTAAVRDEGTSYHYLPASRTVEPSSLAVDAIVATAERHGVPHVRGSTWTIDALYRGDPWQGGRPGAGGVPHGRDGGGGFLRRRGVPRSDVRPGALRGDDLSGDGWDQRGWDEHTTGRETVFRIAAEAVLTLAPDSLPTLPGS